MKLAICIRNAESQLGIIGIIGVRGIIGIIGVRVKTWTNNWGQSKNLDKFLL
jgi:hypothetical protein